MGLETGYQVKIPSKQLNNKKFSTLSFQPKLNPWIITGFTDVDGCFTVNIVNDKNLKVGWSVKPNFQIKLHIREATLIFQLQTFFDGIGSISINENKNSIKWTVSNLKDLITYIISHFEKYPLLSQKAADFILFKLIINLINKKAHLNSEGFQNIINIKASMNLGLS